MMTPSRRVLLGWIGTLIPALSGETAWAGPAESAPTPVEFLAASQRTAAIGLGEWLTRKGITPAALGEDQKGATPARDIRESFAKDSLITVDGFLLPLGFCRYCLDAYRKES